MSRLIPEGFLTLSQAAQLVAMALYGGIPDRDAVRLLKESGDDVADGAALDEAIGAVWRQSTGTNSNVSRSVPMEKVR